MKINSKLIEIDTKDLIGMIYNFDNGIVDDIITNNPKTIKNFDNIRKQMIEILLQRYSSAMELNKNIDYDLRKAYDLYLKHYL